MFSKQMASLMNIRSLSDLQQALRNLLGNCSQPLEHRGPVSIDVTRPDKASDAALTVSNGWTKPGTPDGSNGFAVHVPEGIARFDGPIWPMFRPNWIKFVLQGPLLAVPGADAPAQVVQQQPQSDYLVNDLVGTTVTITNEIGYWSGDTGDAGEASIWYTDQPADEYEWRPRVIKTQPETFEPVADDSAATCTDATCKPYYFTLTIDDLGSGGDCEELNGSTFLLTYTSSCTWKIDGLGIGGTCDYDEIKLTVTSPASDTVLTVEFIDSSNSTVATATHTITGNPASLCDAQYTSWTWTPGSPPDVTGPPVMTLTPYLPSYYTSILCGCPANKVPNSYTLVISGTGNGTCTGCSAWDGTYVLASDGGCGYNLDLAVSSGSGACGASPNWLDYLRFLPAIGSLTIYGAYAGTRHATVNYTGPAEYCWGWHERVQTSVTDIDGVCSYGAATFSMSVNP